MNWNPVGVGARQDLSICDPDLSPLTWGFPAAGEISRCSPEAAAGLSWLSPLQSPAQSGSIWLKRNWTNLKVYIQARYFICPKGTFFFFHAWELRCVIVPCSHFISSPSSFISCVSMEGNIPSEVCISVYLFKIGNLESRWYDFLCCISHHKDSFNYTFLF